MKKFFLLNFILGIACLLQAAPNVRKIIKKSYPAYSKNMPVLVCPTEQDVPSTAETLGTILITSQPGKNCLDSVSVLETLKRETRKTGGNTLHIKSLRKEENCYQMMAVIMRTSEAVLRDSIPEAYADALSPFVSKRQNILSTWRIEAGVGYGCRTASIPDGLTPMMDYFVGQLTSGVSIHTSIDFFPSKYVGIGVMYYTYRAHADMWVSTDLSGGGDPMICRDAINFIAPALLLRYPISSRWTFDSRLAPGYINYKEKLTLLNNEAKVKGNSIGFHASISTEYKLADCFGVFFTISTTQGWIKNVTAEGTGMTSTDVQLGSNETEALSQLSFGAGFRFHIK